MSSVGCQVLVADDTRTNRLFVEAALKRLEYSVVTVADGQEALAALREDDGPMIAIVDWEMPGMDGPTLCRSLRSEQMNGYVYVILLTGKADTADVVDGLDSGADDYMTKPVNVDELRARIRVGERMVTLHRRLKESEEALRVQATQDALTGALNRHASIPGLAAEIDRARASGAPLSVAMIDLDHFKRVNDTYGHVAGDGVLAGVCDRMREAVRGKDQVCRYGGEEFLVILPSCGARQSLRVAERIAQAVRESPIVTSEASMSVTCSVGIATLQHDPNEDASDLVSRADEALLRAKRLGRDRVEAARVRDRRRGTRERGAGGQYAWLLTCESEHCASC